MDIWELANTINRKRGGDVNDFIDFLIIVRRWFDINFTLGEEVMGNFIVSKELCLTDQRFITLREEVMNKPVRKGVEK